MWRQDISTYIYSNHFMSCMNGVGVLCLIDREVGGKNKVQHKNLQDLYSALWAGSGTNSTAFAMDPHLPAVTELLAIYVFNKLYSSVSPDYLTFFFLREHLLILQG